MPACTFGPLVFQNAPLNFRLCKNISTDAQYITLDNKIKCVCIAVFFGNPTNKTVTGTV